MTVFEEDLLSAANEIKKLGIKGKTFFITGATGLVGSFLAFSLLYANKRFSLDNRVLALARNREKAEKLFKGCPGLEVVVADVLNPISCDQEIDYIIHAASETKSQNMVNHPVGTLWTSLEGSKNLLDFAKTKKIETFLYLSSMEAFGNPASAEKMATEDELGYIDLKNVRSCYSESKRMVENMCVCYLKEYSVPVVIARLAQTFGAGAPKDDNRVFAQFARAAIRGEDIVLHTSGESYGNYVYTADAARALFLLLIKGSKGEVYTVVNEQSTMTIRAMAEMVASSVAKDKISVRFEIPKSNIYGYAPDVKLRLSGEKINALGWSAKVNLSEAYCRLIKDWEER